MITVSSSGSFGHLESFLKKMGNVDIFNQLEPLAQEGVNALASATPVNSGLTAASWDYEIIGSGRSTSIVWTNSNIVDGRPIAVMLQFGHGTGTGGYVEGRDYINPALKPIFDKIAEKAWKVVTSA